MTFCIICRIVVEDFVCHISQCEYALGQQPSLGHVTKPALSGQGSSKQMSYYAIALRRAGLKHFFFHCFWETSGDLHSKSLIYLSFEGNIEHFHQF